MDDPKQAEELAVKCMEAVIGNLLRTGVCLAAVVAGGGRRGLSCTPWRHETVLQYIPRRAVRLMLHQGHYRGRFAF